MRTLLSLSLLLCTIAAYAQRPVHFPLANGTGQVQADLYGSGHKALILAHGGRFDKSSWKPQAEAFAKAGFLVLALQFRGDAHNPDGSPSSEGSEEDNALDVLAAVHYLQGLGVRSISAVGGSLGGDAVGDADAESPPGRFDRVVFLSSAGGSFPEKLTGRKLLIVEKDDSNGDGPRLPSISRNYQLAPKPKRLVVLKGSVHAQFIFGTPEGPHLLRIIFEFLQ